MRRSLLLFLSILLFVPATASADSLIFEEETAIDACSVDLDLFDNCKHWLQKAAFQDLLIAGFEKMKAVAQERGDERGVRDA